MDSFEINKILGALLFSCLCLLSLNIAADAMFAPVVLRFRTYEVELPRAARIYYDAMLALPALQEWIAAAERESESIPPFDMYE